MAATFEVAGGFPSEVAVIETATGNLQGSQYGQGGLLNPQSLDILQIVAQGGKVVWNLTAAGVANTNPVSPTATALLAQIFGSSFAAAFASNVSNYDVFHIVSPSNNVGLYVNSAGVVTGF